MKLRGKTLTWRATPRTLRLAALPVLPLALLAGCGGSSEPGLPQLTAASPATLKSCSDLASRINFANTRITAAAPVDAGTLYVAGKPVRAHCQVTGKMFERVSHRGRQKLRHRL